MASLLEVLNKKKKKKDEPKLTTMPVTGTAATTQAAKSTTPSGLSASDFSTVTGKFIPRLYERAYRGKDNVANTKQKLIKQFGFNTPELQGVLDQVIADAANQAFLGKALDAGYNDYQSRLLPALSDAGWSGSQYFPDTSGQGGDLGSGGIGGEPDYGDMPVEELLSQFGTIEDINEFGLPSYLQNAKASAGEFRQGTLLDSYYSKMLDQLNKQKGQYLLAQGLEEYENDPLNVQARQMTQELLNNPETMTDEAVRALLAQGQEPLVQQQQAALRSARENLAGRGLGGGGYGASIAADLGHRRASDQGQAIRNVLIQKLTQDRADKERAIQNAAAIAGQQQGVRQNTYGNIANILAGYGSNRITSGLEGYASQMAQEDLAQQQLDMGNEQSKFGVSDLLSAGLGIAGGAMTGGFGTALGNMLFPGK